MIDFSDIDQHQNEREDGSVEDPLRVHRTASNEIVFVSGIAGIINEENFIIPSGQGEKPASFLGDAVCVDQAFPCLLSKDICGYKAPQDITISPARYFNQSLLNFNQGFGSDANYICFASSVYEQHHLRSSIRFAMHKIKPSTLTAGTVKSNFKETIETYVARKNTFSFMISVEGPPAHWKQFLYDPLAMLKQLRLPTRFSILLWADLRCEELPYLNNKLNNLGLSNKKLKKKAIKNGGIS